MPESKSSSLRHWESYYRGGALASCPLGPGMDYTQELREVWVEFFSVLPDGARILDVGTGNGAIALIASQAAAAAGRTFEIHGSDLARIDPVRDVANGASLFRGIRFHAAIATEQLPFESESFDAVSGQYALEYTEPSRSLPEIRRMLRAGGRAQFVLHHADSAVARNARESLAQSALVLTETNILRLLRRWLDAERRAPAAARKSRGDLAAAMRTLARAAAQTANALTLSVTLDGVQKLAAARRVLTPGALEREIDRFEDDLRSAARRLKDLVRSGQSPAAMEELAQQAERAGFRVQSCTPQLHGGNLVGWRLRLSRHDGPGSTPAA
jgi:ubiquinone/menaquinone biosynthesis C-methylase UbiE